MRSGRLAKSVEAKLEKARARGEKVLPSPREKRAPGAAGRGAGALESEPAHWRAGGRWPLHPQQSSFQTENNSLRAPRPARPPPAPQARSTGVPGPSAQPSALPGGPAYLSEAACPGEGSAEPGEPRAKWQSPQPLARTHAATAANRSRSVPPDPGAPGKSPHRRPATAPHRAAPSGPGPRPPALPPAASAPDSGVVAVLAAALPSRCGGPGSQAPIAARRALTHTHSAASWLRQGIPERTDPFPPFFPLSPSISTSL